MEVHPLDPTTDGNAVAALLAAGNGLSEHKQRDLRRSTGYAGFIARDGATIAGYAHVSQSHGSGEWGLEIVTQSGAGVGAWKELISAACRFAGPDRSLNYWPGSAHAGWAAARDWPQRRRLCRYEADLPLAPVQPAASVTVAPVPQDHDDEILAINNRAFSGHPEQGDWTLDRIDELRNAPWFDPDGVLGAWDEIGLAGFCWTKVHGDGYGEIYIIAVDPGRRGRGIGKYLVAAAMEYLFGERDARQGLLYVDAGNAAARSLYERLGFRVAAESICYSVPGE